MLARDGVRASREHPVTDPDGRHQVAQECCQRPGEEQQPHAQRCTDDRDHGQDRQDRSHEDARNSGQQGRSRLAAHEGHRGAHLARSNRGQQQGGGNGGQGEADREQEQRGSDDEPQAGEIDGEVADVAQHLGISDALDACVERPDVSQHHRSGTQCHGAPDPDHRLGTGTREVDPPVHGHDRVGLTQDGGRPVDDDHDVGVLAGRQGDVALHGHQHAAGMRGARPRRRAWPAQP